MDIILGKERRRWSLEEKRAIVAETFEPGAVILEICRRRQVASGQLHTWRKQYREELGFPAPQTGAIAPVGRFMPLAMIGGAAPPAAPSDPAPMIEIDFSGAARVWITGAASTDLVGVVLKALARK